MGRAVITSVLLLAVACAPAPPADEPGAQPEGHRRMLRALERIAAETPDTNLFLGDREVRELAARYDALGEDSSDVERWRLVVQMGKADLKIGETERAIERLSEAHRRLGRIEDQTSAIETVDSIFRLGVAHMRSAEDRNCCLRSNPESCILPIAGGGIHTDRAGSEQAIPYFEEVLRRAPANSRFHFRARWLMNIATMTLGEYPDGVPAEYLIPPEAFASEEAVPRFRNVAQALGIDVFDLSGGAVVDDLDNDGYLDILTSTWDTSGPMRLFRNEGDGTFTDRTEAAGLAGLYGGLNLKHADYDNDGDIDILVLRGAWLNEHGRHPNSLLRNNGDGTFTDVSFDAGLAGVDFPTQTAGWADYDLDGDVDLYVGNESTPALEAPSQLFRNNGDGTFTDVAEDAGVQNRRWAKGVSWGDYDDDRLPDLYVSNLAGDNRLYRNNGDGTFTDMAPELGVTRPEHSFAVWFWDFDNDGNLDLYVAGYTPQVGQVAAAYLGFEVRMEPAALYRGDGRGGFAEVGTSQNVDRPITTMGSNYGDLDNDGYPDFYLGTGYPLYESLMPNLMYRNRGGTGFADVTASGGFGHLQKGHAVVFADIDNDGDSDIFEQMGGAYPGDKFGNALYENPGFGNHWLAIKLVGTTSNRGAMGARIQAVVNEDGERRSIFRHVDGGGSFGTSPLRQILGLGKATSVELLEVVWPATGETQLFRDVQAGQAIEIVEGRDEYVVIRYHALVLGS